MALDFIVGCLSSHDIPAIHESLHSILVSRHFNWRTTIEIADDQLMTPALWVAIKKRQLIRYLPLSVREHLFKSHFINLLRNKEIRYHAIQIIARLNQIGVQPLLLKGVASLFVRTFEDPGSRVMSDIDMLVPEKLTLYCWNSLINLGYNPIADNPRFPINYQNHHHLRPLFLPNEYAKLEIHRDVLPKSISHLLPSELMWQKAVPINNDLGIAMYVASPTHRIQHNIIHQDIVNKSYSKGKINLRSLHELMVTKDIYHNEIDWQTIERSFEHSGHEKVLSASLYLAHRLFGSPIPNRFLQTPRTKIYYARILSQVRWSWINEAVERVFWFSRESICERYKCDDKFRSVFLGRSKLVIFLFWKYTCYTFSMFVRKISNPFISK
jgi:hypothetical protein